MVITINFKNKSHKVALKYGEEGKQQFMSFLHRVYNLDKKEIDICISFAFKDPCSDDTIILKGMQCYDAAMFCAALTACAKENDEKDKKPKVYKLIRYIKLLLFKP